MSLSLGVNANDDDAAFVKAALEATGDLGITDEEYRSGSGQKVLEIPDPEKAFVEPRWNSCASIGLGDGYSVALQFRKAHPIVAEYQRRVMIFAGSDRNGMLSGFLQLQMNYGGRTHMLVYRHVNSEGKVTHVTFEAREGGEQSIRLQNPDFEAPPEGSKREYVGLVSGEAYPLKFMTPMIVPEEVARRKME